MKSILSEEHLAGQILALVDNDLPLSTLVVFVPTLNTSGTGFWADYLEGFLSSALLPSMLYVGQ